MRSSFFPPTSSGSSDCINLATDVSAVCDSRYEGDKCETVNQEVTVKIINLNVQSLTNKLEKLEILLAEENPAVVSIVEHWCHPDQISNMATPGYDLVTSYCRPTRQNGGTALYVNHKYEAQTIDVQDFNIEMQFECCAIKFNAAGHKMMVLSIYHPPSGDVNLFLTQLSNVLEFYNEYDRMFICGDFNINYLVDSTMKQLFDHMLLCYGLAVTSMEPTRVSTNRLGQTTVSKLDYILTNVNQTDCSARVFEAHFGDHRLCSLTYLILDHSQVMEDKAPKYKEFRNFSDRNIDNLAHVLSRDRKSVV